VLTIRALHFFSAAVLGLALMGVGSVHARRAPSCCRRRRSIRQRAPRRPRRECQGRRWSRRRCCSIDLIYRQGSLTGNLVENAGKAIIASQRSRALGVSDKLDQATWNKLCESTSAPVLVEYTVPEDDVRGRFMQKIPRDFEGMARLHGLSYRSAAQLLAEKFHTSEELIKQLNPGKTLDHAGIVITVPNVVGARPEGQVLRIEVDKPAKGRSSGSGAMRVLSSIYRQQREAGTKRYLRHSAGCEEPHLPLRPAVQIQRPAGS
jgi:hypothetical protein